MCVSYVCFFFFFKQKTAYEMRISDWSSDVCSSDLSLMLTRGDVGMQRGPDGGRYRIDRMSLRPAVLMIHQETLIVAFDKTRPHQLGHGPADRRHADRKSTRLNSSH